MLERVLAAVTTQALGPALSLELLVCDSGSQDGSVAAARGFGAEVLEIAPGDFSHGRTRNLLMERSRGELVAFLTQDAVPDGPQWLERLVGGFSAADDVGLSFGPYRPRPDASPMVARELTEWFASFSPSPPDASCSPSAAAGPGASPALRIDRLGPVERDIPARALLGHRGFFTDANGCVARAAWRRVPFRDVTYAEDHLLAHDMMRAGFAKVYVPLAAVVHSHDYTLRDWLRRSFDEGRALRQVYGWAEPMTPGASMRKLRGSVGADWRWRRSHPPSRRRPGDGIDLLARSSAHHLVRIAGAALGARADRLAPPLVRAISLERRDR